MGIFLLMVITPDSGGAAHDVSIIVGSEDMKTARVRIRRPFFVKLPVQLGTGCSWTIARLPKTVVIVSKTVETPGSLLPGGAEYQVFQMKLEAPGNGRVILNLAQPFERQGKPTALFC